MRLVGIDLGGTAIKGGAVTSEGQILERRSIATEIERGADAVLDRLAQLARELGAYEHLGVGSPGLIDRERGLVLECPNLQCLQEVPIRRELARRLSIDEAGIHLENDANAAALGEHWLGTGRDEN